MITFMKSDSGVESRYGVILEARIRVNSIRIRNPALLTDQEQKG